MHLIKKFLAYGIFSFALLVNGPQAQESQADKPSSDNAEVIEVGFCDLLAHPEQYQSKILRVQALYAFGFEASVIYSESCPGRAWVEIDPLRGDCSPERFRKAFKLGKNTWKTINLTAKGKLTIKKESELGFGQMNGFDYLFTVQCIESVKKPSKVTN